LSFPCCKGLLHGGKVCLCHKYVELKILACIDERIETKFHIDGEHLKRGVYPKEVKEIER